MFIWCRETPDIIEEKGECFPGEYYPIVPEINEAIKEDAIPPGEADKYEPIVLVGKITMNTYKTKLYVRKDKAQEVFIKYNKGA